jgi:hypothetical protein
MWVDGAMGGLGPAGLLSMDAYEKEAWSRSVIAYGRGYCGGGGGGGGVTLVGP